jgi:ADP-ribose pyrophosphatase YjhB (NUDIX family)
MELADELRAIAANGIHYQVNEYDLERYQRLQRLAAELLSEVDTRGADELQRAFHGDVGPHTPRVAADAAVFDAQDRLLVVQRADSGLWCMPGGACDVGEPPSRSAEREAFEESGYVVRARRLFGVYDNRAWKGDPEAAIHIYHVVVGCDLVGGEATLSTETTDVRWVTADEAAGLPLFRSHARKIPAAFQLHGDPAAPAELD